MTYKAFIRKNTESIKEGLRNLGIVQNDLDDGVRPWIAVNYGMWISVDEGYDKLFPDDIDCGDNEDLFLAIVAINDKTDFGQWFKIPNIKTINVGGYVGQQGLNGFQRKVIDVEYIQWNKRDRHISDLTKTLKDEDEKFLPKKLTIDELKLWFTNKLTINDYENEPVIKEYLIQKRDK